MKSLYLVATFIALSSNLYAEPIYEIVSTKFNEGIEYPAQLKAMQKLDSVVSTFEGFESRRYYYSADLNRWTDIVTWQDVTLAIAASKQAFNNETALNVFSMMEDESQIFSYNHLIGTLDKNR
ncbi:hypothetical protein [Marinomonas sp. PE14-40]|uniref:hypothetical protein n=1 Tax=Marinomonas sp. PE14-40 TaxID=3060621 RepID=UPI003F67C686